MPKIWTASVDTHRRAVREAILDAAASLMLDQGLLSVTMSGIAEETGIGRATLYKYFPDAEAILVAWHDRQVAGHLEQLVSARDSARPGERLQAVLESYALMLHGRPRHLDLPAAAHGSAHLAAAQEQLTCFLVEILEEAVRAGEVRGDIGSDELAGYCLNALAAAGSLTSKAAVRRLVKVVLSGIRP